MLREARLKITVAQGLRMAKTGGLIYARGQTGWLICSSGRANVARVSRRFVTETRGSFRHLPYEKT